MSEVELYQPPAELAVRGPVVPEMDSWISVCSDVIKVANVICDTPFVPDGLRGSGPAVAAAILAGRELSLGPMTSLANIHVIKGKPALSAVLMRALIQGAGHQWEDVDVTETRAVIRARRRGESEWTQVSFTADQARTAKIDLGGYPQDKLYARATSRLARRKFADVIAGMPYSAEELEDGGTDPAAPDGVMLAGDPGYAADRQAAKEAVKPAQRTARRRQPAAETPAPPDPTPAPRPVTASPPSGSATGDLPPLPGEPDDAPGSYQEATEAVDSDAQGTVTPDQLTKMWTVFTTEFKFTADQKSTARGVCERIIGRKLIGGTTGNMSLNEARACIDTLERIAGLPGNAQDNLGAFLAAQPPLLSPREIREAAAAQAAEADGEADGG